MPNTCPNCRRSVRDGAKFCGYCAANLTPASPPAAASVPSPNLLPVAPSLDLTSEVLLRRAKRKRTRLVVSLVFSIIICMAIAIPLAFFGRPLIINLFSPATPTSTATQTAISVPTNTPTLIPSATRVPSATPTRTPSPTPSMSPSPSSTRVLPPTYTSTPLPFLLFDDFSQPINLLWETWGLPEPTTVITGTTSILLLNGANVDAAGISSLNNSIPFTPGLIIIFKAGVDTLDDDNAMLRFGWSQGNSIPPDASAPLPFSLLIESNQLTVQIIQEDGTSTSCFWPIEDTIHTVQITLDRQWLPIIFLDDNPVCENLLTPITQIEPLEGRIHFSGSGLVDDLSVSLTP